MNLTFTKILASLFVISLIISCSGKKEVEEIKNTGNSQKIEPKQEIIDEAKMKEMIIEAESGSTKDSLTVEDSEIMAEPVLPKVQINVENRSPGFSSSKVNITWPEPNSVQASDDIFVIIEVENIQLGKQTPTSRADEISNSINGQHVHLILDNKPYKAIYEAGKPINLGKLSPGPHTLFAFPSRSYHESIKARGAADLLNFYVTDSSLPFKVKTSSPAIFYSRPKGQYEGLAAKKIMLDFYLQNINLSPGGFNVKYTITNKADSSENYSIRLNEWKPAFITGLETGTYIIKIELIDSLGRFVNNVAYNGTSREIKVVSK